MPSTDRRNTECGTKEEYGPDIPGSVLDIIVKRIGIALLERSQGGGTLHHFPHTQNYHPDEVEQQSKQDEELHERPTYRGVSFTAGFPDGVDYQSRQYG